MKRIVIMKFKEECVEEFKTIFRKSRVHILKFDGCHHVELLIDLHDPTVMSTWSIWTDEEALNHYRNSEFFAETWAATKVLFRDKPMAFSFNELSDHE
ncbi:MAG TPA: antibiotic biosynthesis monooxygenase [Saprospiraceae bacterium]|nr:antibiotic biosynthesis monooxygenase [Saprospiraceae bacterium]